MQCTSSPVSAHRGAQQVIECPTGTKVYIVRTDGNLCNTWLVSLRLPLPSSVGHAALIPSSPDHFTGSNYLMRSCSSFLCSQPLYREAAFSGTGLAIACVGAPLSCKQARIGRPTQGLPAVKVSCVLCFAGCRNHQYEPRHLEVSARLGYPDCNSGAAARAF